MPLTYALYLIIIKKANIKQTNLLFLSIGKEYKWNFSRIKTLVSMFFLAFSTLSLLRLQSLWVLQWRFTENEQRVVLKEHLYTMMKHFRPNRSGFLQTDHRAWGVSRTNRKNYGRFWSGTALQRHFKNTKWGNIFWKNNVPSLQ